MILYQLSASDSEIDPSLNGVRDSPWLVVMKKLLSSKKKTKKILKQYIFPYDNMDFVCLTYTF